MKKNISINISGIIFHIEEDGYDELKTYLDSIHRYFSTFDDSSEILADIESRIAEIFLSKLSEEKQVISREDVLALIATMGSVSDFRAEETADDQADQESSERQEDASSSQDTTGFPPPPKKLWRDERRKILGGVCAGLGNYFQVDPLWFRLIFAALLPAGGFIVILYIVLWVAIPASWNLEDPVKGKKMFRDPQTKVIGGVSGGIAAYLGIDIVIVRVLFIALAFAGGFGILLYILLWVILPEAITLTDRMQMQGEPVTLSNIESTIKRKLNIREGESESTLSTIILFPFRVIGELLTALGRIIGPLGEAVRIVAGIGLLVVGFALVLSVLVTAGLIFGVYLGGVPGWLPGMVEADLPWEAFTRTLPAWLILAGVLASLIPSLFLVLLGSSILARRVVFQGAFGWSLLALFIASLGALAIGIPGVVYSFHEEGGYRVESVYPVEGKTIVLKLDGHRNDYDGVRLFLRGHDEPMLKLVEFYEAKGTSPAQAAANARMIEYEGVTFTDSVLTFGSQIHFKDNAVFRAQRLDLVLYLPYEQPFVMDSRISRFVSRRHHVDRRYYDGYTWKMTPDGLQCITCELDSNKTSFEGLRDFSALKLTGRFDIRIRQGDSYRVEWRDDNRASSPYTVERHGETLVVEYQGGEQLNWDWENLERNWEMAVDELELDITLPRVTSIQASGMGTIRLRDVSTDQLVVETRGPIRVRGDLRAAGLDLRLTGRSEADLEGEVGELRARIEFASRLSGEDLIAREAYVRVTGASKADVHVTGTLEKDEGVASHINYRGNPQIVRHR